MSHSPFVKKFSRWIELGVRGAVAGGLLVWSVWNFHTNLTIYRNSQDTDSIWWVTFLFVIVTTVLPFAVGVWLLVRGTERVQK